MDSVVHLPRLSALRLDDDTFLCAKGCYLERYRRANNVFTIDHQFSPFEASLNDITQVSGSESSEYIFLCADRRLIRCLRAELLGNASELTHTIRKERKKIVYSYQIEEKLLVVYSDSSMDLRSQRDLDTVDLNVEAPKIMEIMGCVCTGDSWSECRVFVFTYLGSMLQIVPSKGSQPVASYDGNPGMVFDATIFSNHIFTVHDDRSLRVWPIYCEGETQSVTAEFAHKARPFAVCVGGNNTLYTASNDRTIVQWKWHEEEHKLEPISDFPINIGIVRTLVPLKDCLIVGSDAGHLVSVPMSCFDLPSYGIPGDPEQFVRSCWTEDGKDFVINSKGQVISLSTGVVQLPYTVRYFASGCGFTERDLCVAWDVRNIALISDNPTQTFQPIDNQCVFVSVITCADRILAAQNDDVILNLESLNGSLLLQSSYSARNARQSINKKGPFVISSTACIRTRKRTHYLFGCMTGHVLSATFCDENGDSRKHIDLTVEKELSTLFGGESIQDLWAEDGILYALGKNGYMMSWEVDGERDDLTLNFLQKEPVARSGGLDWPCRFVETLDEKKGERRRFVVGFHSTVCVLVDLSSRLVVWRAECGGGNRYWQFGFADGKPRLGYIRDEKFCTVTSESTLELPYYLDRVLHSSKIVFLETLSFDGQVYVISAGSDNLLVLSRLDKGKCHIIVEIFEPEGFVSGSLQGLSQPGHARLFVGLAKSRCVIYDVDLTKKNGLGDFLPSSLMRRKAISGAELNVSGRLQVTAESRLSINSTDDGNNSIGTMAVADDASDSAFLFDVSTKKLLSQIASGDRAGFYKVAVSNGVLIGVSTNGSLYVGDEKSTVLPLGLSSLSALSVTKCDENEDVLIAVGDQSGSIILVRRDGEEGGVRTVQYAHGSIVTDVSLIRSSTCTLVVSVALDCRVVVTKWTESGGEIVGSKVSSVQDPSCVSIVGLSETSVDLLVGGYGFERMTIGIDQKNKINQ